MRQGKFSLLFLILSILSLQTFACTGIQLKTKSESFINGRTVEFGIPLTMSGLIVPRGYSFSGTLPGNEPGIQYQAKYAAVGASVFDVNAIVDGVNEKGLSAGMFYFPGYASYTTVTKMNKSKALAPTEFVNWLLTQFATIEEVKQSIQNIVIAPTGQAQWGGVPPFHYVVYDKLGKSLVIEPIQGKLVMFDNPVGVITNSPTFDWHLTNLSNYINLSPLNVPTKQIDGLKIQAFGQGNGLRGLPGDFTPPSRFVRAVIYAASTPLPDEKNAVFSLFHLLNQFDIPLGAVQSKDNNQISVEWTLATTVKDPNALNYYFRTYDDQNIRYINLTAFDLDAKTLHKISFDGITPAENISGKAIKIE